MLSEQHYWLWRLLPLLLMLLFAAAAAMPTWHRFALQCCIDVIACQISCVAKMLLACGLPPSIFLLTPAVFEWCREEDTEHFLLLCSWGQSLSCRAELQAYTKTKTDEIVNLNNTISRLKKQLETYEAESYAQETKKDYSLQVASQKTLEYGQVCLLLQPQYWNLHQPCCMHRDQGM